MRLREGGEKRDSKTSLNDFFMCVRHVWDELSVVSLTNGGLGSLTKG